MKALAVTAFSVVLCGGSALAAQNVANTSQKGSLLIWPLITIENGEETFIEISNDANRTVKVECYYVNERKGRVDFDFFLTAKQTVSWAVGSMDGDHVHPPAFPRSGNWSPNPPYAPTSANRGELVCLATNAAVTAQIAFNHLVGTATVVDAPRSTALEAVPVDTSAFRYNAWSFAARNASGLGQADNVRQGTPGKLELTGGGAGTYDACPSYNITNFMPNGAVLGSLTTSRNAVTVVSCNQDLRQDYDLYLTKLQFTVWNSREQSYTGAYICVDSVSSVALGSENELFVNGSNFNFTTLRTQDGRFHVRGVQSTQCPGSKAAGLLGLLTSYTSAGVVGTTTNGAGAVPGFVYWDPQSAVELRAPR